MVDAVGTTVFSYTGAGDLGSEDGPWANDTATYTYDSNVPHGFKADAAEEAIGAGPEQLLQIAREHWSTENGQHYRRDRIQDEDPLPGA
jgi:hypothetical protein